MKNITPPPSYDGEQIYVGIDVHKKTYVAVARVGQVVVKKWVNPDRAFKWGAGSQRSHQQTRQSAPASNFD